MRHRSSLIAATALVLLLLTRPVHACSYPDPKPFPQLIKRASSIIIVRLESAHLQRNGMVQGKIRVVQSLRSPNEVKPSYRSILFSTRWCGGIRLDVGHYFLIATDSYGTEIKLSPADQSIIDVTTHFDESRPELSARTDLLRPIHDFVAGKPLPKNFPPTHVMDYTSTVPLPPPPPAR